MSEFRKQLSVANRYEEWLGNLFGNVKEYGTDNKWDILLENGKTIEVKHDYQSERGNMAIEWWCRDKPSGISVSQADYYVYIYPLENEVWKIKTNKLKTMIQDYKDGLLEENWTSSLFYFGDVAGGDDDGTGEGRSKLYLYKREDIKDVWDVIKIKVPQYK